jgi:Lon protease-like protein
MAPGATIPLFPLGSPLFPGMVQQLHIFEPRYRRLVADLLEGAESGSPAVFGVVAIREGFEVGEDGAKALADVGCVAEVRGVATLPDGRFELIVVGFQRFELDDLIEGVTPYLQAHVAWIPELRGDEADDTADQVRQAFAAYRAELARNGGDDGEDDLPEDATLLSYAVGAAAVLPAEDRQRVLAAPNTTERLRLLLALLRRERGMLDQLHAVPANGLLGTPISPN